MAKAFQPREVNMACRAKRPGLSEYQCPGNRVLLFKIITPSGGRRGGAGGGGQRIAYYRCLTCNQVFSLSTG